MQSPSAYIGSMENLIDNKLLIMYIFTCLSEINDKSNVFVYLFYFISWRCFECWPISVAKIAWRISYFDWWGFELFDMISRWGLSLNNWKNVFACMSSKTPTFFASSASLVFKAISNWLFVPPTLIKYITMIYVMCQSCKKV